MKFKTNLIFTFISINLTTVLKTKQSAVVNAVYDLNNEPNTIHIDFFKNSSSNSKPSTTHKYTQTPSRLDDLLDDLALNNPSTSFANYEFVDIPEGEMVTLYPEHDGTIDVYSNICQGTSCPDIIESEHDYTKKFECDESLCEHNKERFMDWNVTDVTDFVENKNIIEILSHNTQQVTIFSKQNKGYLLDGPNDTNKKDSETSFINKTFKFGNEERHDLENEDSIDSGTEKYNKICIADTSSKKIIEDLSSSNDLSITNLEKVNSTFKTLKSYIDMFVSEYIPKTYKFSYLKKLMNVEETCKILDRYQLNFKKYSALFEFLNTEELVNKLTIMSAKFNKNSIFNQETCDKFMVEFDSEIFNIHHSKDFRNNMYFLSRYQQRLFFYHEVIKLYKYVVDLQELLVLFGLFSYKSCANIIYVVHLINLFIENLEVNKVFVLCMIYKALFCFHLRGNFDVFMIPIYEVGCCEKKYDLYHFMWEVNSFIRGEIKNRIYKHRPKNPKEIVHLKMGFLIFLYRHFIFLKYVPIRSEDIPSFQKFVNKVCFAEDCFIDLYNEFLDIIRTSSNVY